MEGGKIKGAEKRALPFHFGEHQLHILVLCMLQDGSHVSFCCCFCGELSFAKGLVLVQIWTIDLADKSVQRPDVQDIGEVEDVLLESLTSDR